MEHECNKGINPKYGNGDKHKEIFQFFPLSQLCV